MYAIAALQEVAKENKEIQKVNQEYRHQLKTLSDRLDKLEKLLNDRKSK